MGYTHYWGNYALGIPDKGIRIIREILDQAYADGIVQLDYDKKEPPLVTHRVVQFNGVGELGHETFCFDVDDDYMIEGGKPFDFCKTNRKPYDEIVMKVLIALKWSLGISLDVTSDGAFDDEWKDARQQMAGRYGIRTEVCRTLDAF